MAVASFLVQTISGIREGNEVQVVDESDFNVYVFDAAMSSSSRVVVAGYDQIGKQCTWSQSCADVKVANILDLGRRHVHLRRPNIVMLFGTKLTQRAKTSP